MFDKKTGKTEKETKRIDYDIEVIRVKIFDNSNLAFDMVVNGVTIYGMIVHEYETEDGSKGYVINFPNYKGKNDKYYNHCFFPFDKATKESILEKIRALL